MTRAPHPGRTPPRGDSSRRLRPKSRPADSHHARKRGGDPGPRPPVDKRRTHRQPSGPIVFFGDPSNPPNCCLRPPARRARRSASHLKTTLHSSRPLTQRPSRQRDGAAADGGGGLRFFYIPISPQGSNRALLEGAPPACASMWDEFLGGPAAAAAPTRTGSTGRLARETAGRRICRVAPPHLALSPVTPTLFFPLSGVVV